MRIFYAPEYLMRFLDFLMEKLWVYLHIRKFPVMVILTLLWYGVFAVETLDQDRSVLKGIMSLCVFLVLFSEWRNSRLPVEIQNARTVRTRSSDVLAVLRTFVIISSVTTLVQDNTYWTMLFSLSLLASDTYVSQIPPKEWRLPSIGPKLAHARI